MLSMVYVFILQVEGYHQSIWSKNPIVCRQVGQTWCTQREDFSNCTQGSSSRDGYHVVCCTLYGLVWYRCKVRLEQRGGVLPVGAAVCCRVSLGWGKYMHLLTPHMGHLGHLGHQGHLGHLGHLAIQVLILCNLN